MTIRSPRRTGAAGQPAPARGRRRAGLASPPPGGRHLLPLLSAVLLVLAFPPFQLLLPSFTALVPVLVFLGELPADPSGRWTAIRAGYLLGLVYFGLLLYWLIVALLYYSWLAVLAWLVTVLVLAGFTALFAGAVVYVRERVPAMPLALSAALFWTATEWLQGHLGDVSFPWLGLGTSLTGFPSVAGAADLVGARGLTFWLVLVNGLVATAILEGRRGRSALRPALLALAAAAIPVSYGYWRAVTLELVPAARVALVQPNIPEELKLDALRALDSSRLALARITRRITPGSVDLVVWPEVALQVYLRAPDQSALRDSVRQLSREVRAPILVGAYGYRPASASERSEAYNAALLVTPAGITGAEYDKQHLVPIVERVPFIDPAWLERFTGPLEWFGGLGRGRTSELFPAGHSRFGTMICYESIFASLGRRYRLQGAAFLVNITNDSWYGRPPWWARTSALWQHPAHMVMRAIENRVGVARAANTGISLFVDPLGRTSRRTPLFAPALTAGTVYTTAGRTLFARWGDWLATLAAAASALLLAGCALAGRRPPAARTG